SDGAYAQLGHGGWEAYGFHQGDITLGQVNDITFSGGQGTRAFAQLGHGVLNSRNAVLGDSNGHIGDIYIAQSRNVTFSGGNGNSTFAQLGHGGSFEHGSHRGAITIASANDVVFRAGSDYAQLGHGGYFTTGHRSGDIVVIAHGNLTLG